MNSVKYSTKALKQLRKLHPDHSKKIVLDCKALVDLATCQNIKRLTNHQYEYRLRVGNYRVFFNHDDGVKIVYIEEVKKRNERTY
jgi:mRNA interferase RelE/StbE